LADFTPWIILKERHCQVRLHMLKPITHSRNNNSWSNLQTHPPKGANMAPGHLSLNLLWWRVVYPANWDQGNMANQVVQINRQIDSPHEQSQYTTSTSRAHLAIGCNMDIRIIGRVPTPLTKKVVIQHNLRRRHHPEQE
jgi:hypothetical protein